MSKTTTRQRNKNFVKHCNGCNSQKSVNQFFKDSILCVECCLAKQDSKLPENDKTRKAVAVYLDERDAKHIKRAYKLTLEKLHYIIRQQNHRCAICQIDLDSLPQKAIHIDHCHKSGKVRGVLCRYCNTGLGFFKDDITALAKAIEYLNIKR